MRIGTRLTLALFAITSPVALSFVLPQWTTSLVRGGMHQIEYTLSHGAAMIEKVSSGPEESVDDVQKAKGYRPLVIWHGLGDSAHADGITGFIDEIKEKYPGIFVHSVSIPTDGNADAERKAGFFGKAEEQGDEGCAQISSIPELADGFDAMGFSQGGLFLRYYVQNCNKPPVRNLMTFGTPHYGISALLPCPTPPSLSCILAARAARAGIYTRYAQDHLIQAQYYRDVERLDEFWRINTFLMDLNADFPPVAVWSDATPEQVEQLEKGEIRIPDLAGLENFVAVMFDADLSPAQSAHFGSYAPNDKTVIVPIEQQSFYWNNTLGLRQLNERGDLHLLHCPGEHMDLDSGNCAMDVVDKWVGTRV